MSAAFADYSVDRGSEIRQDTDAQVQCPLLLIRRQRFGDTKRYGRAGLVSAAAAAVYYVDRGSEIRQDTDAQVQCPLLLLIILSTEVRRYDKIRTRRFSVRCFC